MRRTACFVERAATAPSARAIKALRLAALCQFIISTCSEVSVVVKPRLFGLVSFTIAANSKMSLLDLVGDSGSAPKHVDRCLDPLSLACPHYGATYCDPEPRSNSFKEI